MNPVLILSYNALPLLKQCVESVQKQDIPAYLGVIDNGSSDGSPQWLKSEEISGRHNENNIGVSAGWNQGLDILFGDSRIDYVLVLNQDVILPPFFYRELLAKDLPFVTGYPVESLEEINAKEDLLVPSPCFSAFLIRRTFWEKVGKFDENLWGWAGDCDYHVRGHRMGLGMYKTGVPFFHAGGGSSVIKSAPPREKRHLEMQADADRMTFAEMWKAEVGSPQYKELFSPEAFGIDADLENAC